MYSLTICFGPAATTWAFLFNDKVKANAAQTLASVVPCTIVDDFGQVVSFGSGTTIHGACMEDLYATEAARIQRSLAEERVKVKLMAAAKADPVISEAIRRQQGAPVLTPMRGF